MTVNNQMGPAFDSEIDGPRLNTQREVLRENMLRRKEWATLREISLATGYPESSISAQLRHLRKKQFGHYILEKKRMTSRGGTWGYRLRARFELV